MNEYSPRQTNERVSVKQRTNVGGEALGCLFMEQTYRENIPVIAAKDGSGA
jgi:hypothetical protein